MIKANKQLGIYPDIQGNSVAQVFKTSKKTGKLIFENNTFYKEVDNVKTEIGSGSGTTTDPAGSDTQVQYNDSGSFGASSNFTYNDTEKLLVVTGDSSNSKAATLAFSNGPGEATSAYIQEVIPQSGAALDIYTVNRRCVRFSAGAIFLASTEGSYIISEPVSASVSNPPTNSEIESNSPPVAVHGDLKAVTGSLYYLIDTNTGTAYTCYAIADSTWVYTALTPAV